MLSGIITPTEGVIQVGGICPNQKRKEYVSRMGAVFGQRSQLWWDLPVSDSFKLLKEIYSVPQKQYDENLKFFTDILDIETYFYKPVRQLSLGQRMRCEVAAAFIHNPSIVFLDEPTIGLDVIAKENIRNFIKIANSEKNITVILTSHDLADIETVCNRMIVIDGGRIVYTGSVNEVGDIHGKKRNIVVELSEEIEINDQRIKILSDEGKKKQLEIELSDISVRQVVDILTKKAELVDMKISGIPIEVVVKDIYLGKFGKNKLSV